MAPVQYKPHEGRKNPYILVLGPPGEPAVNLGGICSGEVARYSSQASVTREELEGVKIVYLLGRRFKSSYDEMSRIAPGGTKIYPAEVTVAEVVSIARRTAERLSRAKADPSVEKRKEVPEEKEDNAVAEEKTEKAVPERPSTKAVPSGKTRMFYASLGELIRAEAKLDEPFAPQRDDLVRLAKASGLSTNPNSIYVTFLKERRVRRGAATRKDKEGVPKGTARSPSRNGRNPAREREVVQRVIRRAPSPRPRSEASREEALFAEAVKEFSVLLRQEERCVRIVRGLIPVLRKLEGDRRRCAEIEAASERILKLAKR